MKRYFLGFLYICVAALPAEALAHGPHVHGTGELHIAIENNNVSIDLHSPLENLLGFEHMPNTDAQRLAVKTMVAKIDNPAGLFKLSIAASCRAQATQIDSPVTDVPAAPSKSVKSAHKSVDTDADHADLTADFQFTCDHIEKLKSIEVNIFDAFPGTRIIKAEIIGPHGQSAKTLSPDHRSLEF